MGIIKDRFKAKSDAAFSEIKDLLKEHGTKKNWRSSAVTDIPGDAWNDGAGQRNLFARLTGGYQVSRVFDSRIAAKTA